MLVKGSLGQQPTRYANTTIDSNVVEKDLWFSLRERITCEMLVCRKLCYSQSLARKCIGQWSSIIFCKSQGSMVADGSTEDAGVIPP